VTSTAALAWLLVRLRWRTLWNGLVRVPRQRSVRLAWLLVALAPAASAAAISALAAGDEAARSVALAAAATPG